MFQNPLNPNSPFMTVIHLIKAMKAKACTKMGITNVNLTIVEKMKKYLESLDDYINSNFNH